MLVLEIIICILTFVATFVSSRMLWYDKKRTSIIFAIIAGVLYTAFVILLILINWNVLHIPLMLLIAAICLFIWLDEAVNSLLPVGVGVVVTIVAFIVTGIIYMMNIKDGDTEITLKATYDVVCTKDNSYVIGSIRGGVIHVEGSEEEKSVYKYYYRLEDGGIKQGTIPVDSTTIYFVESPEEARLEEFQEYSYSINYNKNPATRCFEENTVSYKLFIPEGSVSNEFMLDAE